jgi:hypothetical protein
VPDGELGAARLLQDIGVLRKGRGEPGLRRRHLALRQRDAIDPAHDALRHRPQVVHHAAVEDDLSERSAPALVLARAVVLEHHATAACHGERMQAEHAAVLFDLVEPLVERPFCSGGA